MPSYIEIADRVQKVLEYVQAASVSVNLKKVCEDLLDVRDELLTASEIVEPEKFRKILQISSSAGSEKYFDNLCALCEDGTLWEMYDTKKGWSEIPGIPALETNNNVEVPL